MGLYPAVLAGSFRRYATYRSAVVAGVFTNSVFGLIIACTYQALWRVRPHLGGYGEVQAVTYVWLGQALLAANAMLGGGSETDLIARIRTGDVAIDLYRPADLQAWWLATDLGRAGFQVAARGVPPMLLAGLVFRLRWPASPVVWAEFAAAVLLALLVGFALRYLVALVSFWLLDGTGVVLMANLLAMFFSGMVLPLNVFPGALGELARLLPWSSMLQVPADVFLGRVAGAAVAGRLAFQAGWAVVLLAAGRAVQALATRRVVVQGG